LKNPDVYYYYILYHKASNPLKPLEVNSVVNLNNGPLIDLITLS